MKRNVLSAISLFCFASAFSQQFYTLDACRQMAIENNKELKISEEKIEEEKYKRKAAFTKYLPDFSFTGAYMHNSKNLSLLSEDAHLPVGTVTSAGNFTFRPDQLGNSWTTVNGVSVPLDANNVPFNPATNPEKLIIKDYALIPKEAFEVDMKNVFVGTVTVAQPIYMGGKIRAYNQITRFAEELAKTKHNTGLQEIILKTDEMYWQVVSLTNKKKLAEGYVGLLKKLNQDVENLMLAGVATKAEGLTVKVKLNEAEMTLSKVENGLSLSKMALCQLCGIALHTEFSLQDEKAESTVPEMVLPSADMGAVYAQRPELKSLALADKIYRKKERVVMADMLPQVLLTGNYLVSNPNAYNGIENKFAGMWNVGVAVKVPVFHWGEQLHLLKAAKSESKVIRLQFEEAKEKIELQVNQSMYKVNESAKRLKTSQSNMEKAEENLRYANIGFASGVISSTGVLEAQTAWLSAYSEKIDAEIDVRLSRVYLSKSMGQLRASEK